MFDPNNYCINCFKPLEKHDKKICKWCKRLIERRKMLNEWKQKMRNVNMDTTGDAVVDQAIWSS
jgi:rRNA maturation endonuclease Nob1